MAAATITSEMAREAAVTAVARFTEEMPVWDRWDEARFSGMRATAILVSGERMITVIVPHVMMGIISRSPETGESQADTVGTMILDMAGDACGINGNGRIHSMGAGVLTLEW